MCTIAPKTIIPIALRETGQTSCTLDSEIIYASGQVKSASFFRPSIPCSSLSAVIDPLVKGAETLNCYFQDTVNKTSSVAVGFQEIEFNVKKLCKLDCDEVILEQDMKLVDQNTQEIIAEDAKLLEEQILEMASTLVTNVGQEITAQGGNPDVEIVYKEIDTTLRNQIQQDIQNIVQQYLSTSQKMVVTCGVDRQVADSIIARAATYGLTEQDLEGTGGYIGADECRFSQNMVITLITKQLLNTTIDQMMELPGMSILLYQYSETLPQPPSLLWPWIVGGLLLLFVFGIVVWRKK